MNELILFASGDGFSSGLSFLAAVLWALLISRLVIGSFRSNLSWLGDLSALFFVVLSGAFIGILVCLRSSEPYLVGSLVGMRVGAGMLGGALGFLLAAFRASRKRRKELASSENGTNDEQLGTAE